MKTLILMRHAKSSWKDRSLDDHDRPLKKRGAKAAPEMAHWLQKQGLAPDVVLCSSSRRTRETFDRMRQAVPSLPDPELSGILYEAAPAALMDCLKALPDSFGTALLIGHQPGLGELLRLLTTRRRTPALSRAFEKFPTAAIAVLETDLAAWRDLRPEKAEFIAFATPRELAERLPASNL